MRILGIVNKTHDSGVALLRDGVPEMVLEEERFNRRKHTHWFPKELLRHAVIDRGLSFDAIDFLTTPWHPTLMWRNFVGAIGRRLPSGLALLCHEANPNQQQGLLFINRSVRNNVRRYFGDVRLPPIVNVGHHDAHAAIYNVSPFDAATVLVLDGHGDDTSSSAYSGSGHRLQRHWQTQIFNSIGIVYAFVTEFLGFRALSGEGKVMALAAYGGDTYVERFRDVLRPTPDGRYAVNMDYFAYDTYGFLRPFKRRFFEVFGPARAPEEPLDDRHRDIAHALQTVTEEVILHIVRALAADLPSRNLVLTGGVALNCVANARIAGETPFRDVWVPPVASDTGTPLGSALWHYHQGLDRPRGFVLDRASFGVEYSNEAIAAALTAAGLTYERLSERTLIERAALDLVAGRIVGWYQGRFEMGPRALGHRSMLADPRRPEMRDILNARVKHRESFRPFAPAILAERAAEYFELSGRDPFMTMAPRVRPERRDCIPAGLHIDGTARLQTVERDANPRYYDLIAEFGRLTGVPVLLNTSFNDQEPIVARPEEAIACYQRTELDVLAMGDLYISRHGT